MILICHTYTLIRGGMTLKILLHKCTSLFVVLTFVISSLAVTPYAHSQSVVTPTLQPILTLTQPFNPVVLKGIKVDPANPFKFDFVIDQGDFIASSEYFKNESEKLIKYFLASLAIPESDLWVNLSPYE
ncbi:MAG: hypothetical protein ACI8Q2_000765, partial [Candidatus Omnitrophota bacterium]